MQHLFHLLLLVLGLSLPLHAQMSNLEKLKFGKLSTVEMELRSYPTTPDAAAVVLVDKGSLYTTFNKGRNFFQYNLERHIRIKVFEEAGVEHGNFVVYTYRNGGATEGLRNVKGATFNEVNGKWEETRLDREGIFTEQVTDNLTKTTYVLPQVKAGSIIDLQYTLTSDFLSQLPTWHFQRDIPTDYSELRAEVPEYFLYNLDMKGYDSHTLTHSDIYGKGRGQVSFMDGGRTRTLDYSTQIYHLIAQKVPPFQSEPLSPASRNFLFRINFDFAGFDFPGRSLEGVIDWEDVVQDYRETNTYKQFNQSQDQVSSLGQKILAESPTDTLTALLNGLRERFVWDNRYSIYNGQKIAQAFSKGTANSGCLNGMLLCLLKEYGYEVYPVLLRPRSMGYISRLRPSLTQFQHLVVALKQGENYTYLDVTHPYAPPGQLPPAHLNLEGMRIGSTQSEWVSLEPTHSHKYAIQLEGKLTPDLQLLASVDVKSEGYAAMAMRQNIGPKGSPSGWAQWTSNEMSEIETEAATDITQPVIHTFKLDASTAVVNGGELVYVEASMITPPLADAFKQEKRRLPIDFVAGQTHVYLFSLTLPEGFTVEELPESTRFALPERKGSYSIRYVVLDNTIRVVEKLDIKTPLFTADAYPALREFFGLVAQQREGVIVLRKQT